MKVFSVIRHTTNLQSHYSWEGHGKLIVHDEEFFLLVLVLFTVGETITELKVLHVEVSELFTLRGVRYR